MKAGRKTRAGNKTRRNVLVMLSSLAVGLSLAIPGPTAAQGAFPNKPITVINPYPPGGFTDTLARVIVAEASKTIGQTFVVESRTGASGKIGLDAVLNAPKDGYTIGISVPGALSVFPLLDAKYANLQTRYSPITMAVKTYYGLAINPDVVPARNLKDFITWAKSKERTLSYGSIGLGSSFHLWSEVFSAAAGITPLHVPYKGEAPVITDLMGGQIHFMVASAAARPYVQSGRLLFLATSGSERWDAFPEVPTFKELGMPEMETSAWFGFIAPSGVPPGVLSKLNAALTRAIKMPNVTAAIRAQGYIPVGGSADELAATITRERKQLAEVIKTRNLRFE